MKYGHNIGWWLAVTHIITFIAKVYDVIDLNHWEDNHT